MQQEIKSKQYEKRIDEMDAEHREMEESTPAYKKVRAQAALDSAKGVVIRLRAMKNARTATQFNELQRALRFDMDALTLNVINL